MPETPGEHEAFGGDFWGKRKKRACAVPCPCRVRVPRIVPRTLLANFISTYIIYPRYPRHIPRQGGEAGQPQDPAGHLGCAAGA
eukprot:scaffold14964_cov146-Isochrysis_galbana.AAC.5